MTEGSGRMKKVLGNFWAGGKRRKLEGTEKKILGIIAVVMSLYQIIQSTFFSIQPLLHYCIHLTFIMVLCYLMYTPQREGNRGRIGKADYVVALIAAAAGIYYATQVARYLVRWPQVDPLSTLDILSGIVFVVLVIDGTRRTMGMVLPTIALVFLVYTLVGHLFPGLLYHRQLLPVDILDQLVFTTNGIFTSPIAVSSTYVFLFCLFGSFFNYSGAGDFFYNFSMAVAGRYTGGAGKVAIVSSALFGMINGSPTANVATTGSFTIPMMKKVGYDTEFSGAVCAVASTGGGIMPPIMGTAAFLMVEMAGIPYRDIAIAAMVPGILYYLALMLMVHFRAKKLGLKGMTREELPDMMETLKKGFQFILPLVVLVVMIMQGYTPSMAAVAGIVCVILASFLRKETRMTPKKIWMALEDGALQSVIISMSCAIAGIVICGLMTTGLSGKLASLVLSIGGDNILIALAITALLCILLGMGMPVAAAYALTASLAIPSLYELGVPAMSAHMFVVYYSTMSAITPPVAVASYAAAGIAEGNATKIGWSACVLGSVSFIVPFMFVLQPKLLVTADNFDIGTIWIILTALLGVYAISSGIEGWLFRKINPVFRILLVAAGLMMMYPENISDYLGLGIFLVLALLCLAENRKDRGHGEKPTENGAASV